MRRSSRSVHRWFRKLVPAIIMALIAAIYRAAQVLGWLPPEEKIVPLLALLAWVLFLYWVFTGARAFRFYRRSYNAWAKEKRAMAYGIAISVGAVIGGASGALGWKLYELHRQQMRILAARSETLQQEGKGNASPAATAYQGFREKPPDVVYFSLGGGGMHTSFSAEQLRGREAIPIKMGGFVPIRGHFRDDILYCDVTLWGGVDKPPVEIKDNEFVVRPPGWDRNYTPTVFEVVDEQRSPVLQVIRRSPSHWVVNGIFYSPVGVLVATEEGTGFGSNMTDPALRAMQREKILEASQKLKPIFKYPSSEHPGEYVGKRD